MDQLSGLQPSLLAHHHQQEVLSQGGSSGRSTPSSDSAPGKLFVGGLSWQTTQEKLREYFGQFGSVTDVLVMKDPITQRSRGFGFITFSNPEAVDRVLAVPTHSLDGKKIDPKHATPKSKSKNNKTKKIFVGGVSQETSAEEVKSYFNQFGKVEEAVMLMDQQTKRHRGFGFVTFEHEDTVDRVCEIHFHTIKNKKVECKKAQPKEVVQAANTAALLGKRVILGNLGMMPSLTMLPQLSPAQPQPLSTPALHAALQQQLAASLGSYGKLIGGGPAPLSSYRYSPYPLPSYVSSAGLTGNMANSLQYTVASPMSQQPMTPAILSAITSPALHHHAAQSAPAPGQQHAAGGTPAANNAQGAPSGQSGGGPAGGQLTAAYPYHPLPPIDMAASMAAAGLVDWGSLAYTLPAGMYAL